MTQNLKNMAAYSFQNRVEDVLILDGLFLRERIISSTSAEDTYVHSIMNWHNYLLDIYSDDRVLHSLTKIYAYLCLQSMNWVHLQYHALLHM